MESLPPVCSGNTPICPATTTLAAGFDAPTSHQPSLLGSLYGNYKNTVNIHRWSLRKTAIFNIQFSSLTAFFNAEFSSLVNGEISPLLLLFFTLR